MKRLILFLLCVFSVGSYVVFPIGAADSGEMHWYCTRQKAHRQALAAPELRFVEECGGYYIDHAHGDGAQEKVVYLTFDAGYENGNTPKILDALKKHNAPAAFFLVGNYLNREPELVKRMVEEGHIVGNHTTTHPDMSAIQSEEKFSVELSALNEKYKAIIGEDMKKYYRPPQGKFSEDNLRMAQKLGYKTIFWSLAYVDWYEDNQPPIESAMKTLKTRVHPGAIVLLHSTSSTNAEILDAILTEWENMGYTFKSLDELP
jgi:peptidoglycan-N-acetylmuramic acid deacetylase